MPRLFVLPLLLSAAWAIGSPALAASEGLTGEWLVEDGMAKVAFGPCAGAAALTCGAITWLKDPVGHPTRDIHNPDRSLRNRPLVGLTVVRGVKPDGAGRWSGGRVYDPESGRTGDAKLRLLGGGKLEVKGCLLVVCDGETWTRAD